MCPDFSVVTIMKMLKITSSVGILLSLLISAGCTDNTGTDVNNQSNYEQNSTSLQLTRNCLLLLTKRPTAPTLILIKKAMLFPLWHILNTMKCITLNRLFLPSVTPKQKVLTTHVMHATKVTIQWKSVLIKWAMVRYRATTNFLT